LLSALGYSLQANKKTREFGNHPEGDAQFALINNKVKKFQKEKQPVISVDTKKKELIGNYKNATCLYINADGGGSNGSRNRLWKKELQQFANQTNLSIHVSHFPPGTSKWNKIEHRLFSFISANWRGKPLIDKATVVSLIANTTTKTGLKIKAKLDQRNYQTGIKISDQELKLLNLHKNDFHGEWNYLIQPN
jgi:hypothetical protein